MDWTDFNGHTRRYSYAYDKLDRLVSAEYSEPDGRNLPGVDAAVNTPDYSCRYTYDLNGNMTSVTRKGVTSRIRDGHNYKLIFGTAYSGGFTYGGNQRLSDTQLMPVATFDPLSSMTMQTSIRPGGGSLLIPSRRYDANGNLTSDPSRCIDEITYDINNQPRSIVFTPEQAGMNPTYRSYMYDADGNRLSAATVGAKGRTLRLYCGRYQYDVAMTFPLRSFETFHTSNGYLQNGFMRYYVTDYLGNVRAVVSEDGTVEQSSHYYPYGALMDESLGEDTQPYLFGGKELENMMSLGQYDFGARSYTAVAPAFGRPDPHAANTPQLSPYIYCASNPVAYRDPDGEDAILSIQGNTITIKANVILTGELATNELAQIYQQGINNVWGAIKKVKFRGETFDVVWDVNVSVMPEGEREVFNGVNNYMEVFDPDTKGVDEKNSYVRNSHKGAIRSKSIYYIPLEYDNPMPHEFGHMLGLMDRYGDESYKSEFEIMAVRTILIPKVTNKTLNNLLCVPLFQHRFIKSWFLWEQPFIKRINVYNSEKYLMQQK